MSKFQRKRENGGNIVEAPAEPQHKANELPEGWASGRFDSIAELNPRHPNGLDDSKLVTFVPMTCVSESSPDFDRSNERPFADVRKGYTHFADGDVLFAKITPCMENGKGAVATGLRNGLGCGTTELHVIRPLGGIDPHYVYRFLQQESVRRDAAANFTGSAGQLRAPVSFIAELELPLPPLAEQRRIVGKLELMLGKVSSSQQRLSRVPGLLKRFRQSVLAAACSGKLTAHWREENNFAEPVCDLIARMETERRKRYLELCVEARNAKRGKPQEFDNFVPSVRTDLDTFDLPSDWGWVDLRFVMTVDEPFCYGVVQPGANEPDGKLLVRAGDLQDGTVNLSELRRIPANIDAEYERSRLKGGELLVTVVGAGIGTVAIAPASCAGFNIARAVAKVPIRDVSAEYVFQWFNTSKALSWMVADAREVARPTLNLEQLRTILVPLPPLSEQQEIVRRVEKLFAFADQIEVRLRQAQAHVDRLTQSLLAKAFRGELVPTEHTLATAQGRSYEPATALLARIQAERKSTTEQSPKNRKRHSVQK